MADAHKKLWGRSSRPRRCLYCRFLVLLCFLLRFLFGCHGSILPFHSSWKFAAVFCCNCVDCIESSLIEVKRKMIITLAPNDAPKSSRAAREGKNHERAILRLITVRFSPAMTRAHARFIRISPDFAAMDFMNTIGAPPRSIMKGNFRKTNRRKERVHGWFK
jgi:hypothetical protein